MKVYIALKIGEVTGTNDPNYIKAFNIAEKAETRLLLLGFDPINPMKVCKFNVRWKWIDYMIFLIPKIKQCKAIYLCDNGWEESNGARIELAVAQSHGLLQFCEQMKDLEILARIVPQ